MDRVELKSEHVADAGILSLFGLFWQQKGLVMLLTAGCLAIGLAYNLIATPIYEVNAYITAPMPGDIAPLNYAHSNKKDALLVAYTPKGIYNVFVSNLLANSTKINFFKTVYLPSLPVKKRSNQTQDALFKRFSKVLTIREIPGFKPAKFVVSVKGKNPDLNVAWASQYVSLANQYALNAIQADIKHQCENIVHELQTKIKLIKELAQKKRGDRVVQLKEAISIAQAAGIQDQSLSSLNGTLVDASIMTNPSMMYLRGTKTLQAELDSLARRESDDPYLKNLRKLENQVEFYKNYSINPENLAMFRLDGDIEKPDLPKTPMKGLIMILCLLFGLFLSSIIIPARRVLSLQR